MLPSASRRQRLSPLGLALALAALGGCAPRGGAGALSSAGSSVAASVSPTAARPVAPSPPPAPMGAPYTVELDARGFRIAGRYRLLRGGSVQWFRIAPDAWRDRLERMREAGFNLIDVYVPWNVVEPEEGRFNFHDPDLAAFLTTCRDLGLFVYLRPGPSITNEMDGGGMPAWLSARSTKSAMVTDGLANLRTNDPDFLAPVAKYFQALDAVVRPFLASRGGPVVLVAIENELNWFENFHEIEKLFWTNGIPERPLAARCPTYAYLAALRDILQKDGVDVPITTCPGDGRLSGTGDVPAVVPLPNIYDFLTGRPPENLIFDGLTEAHDPLQHGGAYASYPLGTTETTCSPQRLRRLFGSGLDLACLFNAVGGIQEGYRNGMAMNPAAMRPPTSIASFLANPLAVLPEVAYHSSIFDAGGPITPGGGIREDFFRYRRDALFLESVEESWASVERPLRSGYPGGDPRLVVRDPALGVKEGGVTKHYWLEGRDGARYVTLLNASGGDRRLAPGTITLGSRTVPRFAPLHIPGKEGGDAFYAHELVAELPIAPGALLAWTTSELLTARPFGSDRLLVVYGSTGEEGELAIESQGGAPTLVASDPGVTVRERTTDRLVVSYRHDAHRLLLVELPGGQRLRIVVTTREAAGRFWFLSDRGQDLVLAGPDRVHDPRFSARDLTASLEWTPGTRRRLLAISPAPASTAGAAVTRSWDATLCATELELPSSLASAYAPPRIDLGRSTTDGAEADPSFNDRSWASWQGPPRSADALGTFSGRLWYRVEIDLPPSSAPRPGRLEIESASDIVGVYVNGQYVTTLAPLGTEIDSHHPLNPFYRFAGVGPLLRTGRNVIAFRVETWGHGSFIWPRGKLFGVAFSLPALGYDQPKGLIGRAALDGHPLERWTARAELGGERAAYADPRFDDSRWTPDAAPLRLGKGEIRWFRTELATSDLPDEQRLLAPVACLLKGERTKAGVYLNGHLVGRWLSDERWLARGSWVRAARSLFVRNEPDSLPLERTRLAASGRNFLALVVEDASAPTEPPGVVTSIELRLEDGAAVRERSVDTIRWR